jgi:hypothetical protein
MDWYIFLTPLLLLPIIFLFRLVGCGYPEFGWRRDGAPGPEIGVKITFKLNILDPIPFIDPNPIYYIFPKFTIDDPDGEPIGYDPPPQDNTPFTAEVGLLPFTITSVPVQVLAGDHTCYCDVWITRTGIDADPNKPYGEHLIGPITKAGLFAKKGNSGNLSEYVVTFNLSYTRTSANDYPATDFQLTPPTNLLINITLVLKVLDPIPRLQPNPMFWIWPQFTIADPDGPPEPALYIPSQQLNLQDVQEAQTTGLFPPFTITSVPAQVPAGPHICSCDVYITREHIDPSPEQPFGHHLIGPVTVQGEFGEHNDNFVTFNLNYAQTSTTDYPANDFQLTPQPIGP